MKMFPHSFAFFHSADAEDHHTKLALGRGTTEAGLQHDIAQAVRPIKIDIERAVDVMLGVKSSRAEKTREQCRLEIIRSLPAESIDWDTVNWVLLWPFRSARL